VLTVRVVDRLAEIDRAEWDGVGRDPFSRTAVLEALEAAGMPGVRLWYATVRDDRGCLVAAAPFARIAIDAGRLTHGAFRGGIRWVRAVRPGFLHTALLVCGTPLSVGNVPVRLASAADSEPVFRLLAGALDDLGDAEHVPWRVFKEFDAVQIDAARATLTTLRRRWMVVPSEPGNCVHVTWHSFDEFLHGLRSHYRYKIRTAARRLADAGVTVDRVPLASAYDDEAHRLYEAVVDAAQIELERLTPAFFLALGRAAGTAATLVRFWQGAELIGWVATLHDGDTLYDLFHGIDYARNEVLALYFNQLAEVIRLGADLGAQRVVLGQSTDTAKARFGAVSVPLWVAIAHRTRAVTGAMRRAERLLFPSVAPVRRRVFRG
jgi:predicted N-acyltransferase